jgi:hypothetical protein
VGLTIRKLNELRHVNLEYSTQTLVKETE